MKDIPPPISQAIISTIVTVVIVPLMGWLKDRSKKNEERTKAGLYTALIFERYGLSCSDITCDLDDFWASGGVIGVRWAALPPFESVRKEIDVGVLGIDVASPAMEFEIAVATKNSFLYADYAGEDDAYEGAVELGLEAFRIANLIRLRFKLPKSGNRAVNDAYVRLVENDTAIRQKRAKRAQRLQAKEEVAQAD